MRGHAERRERVVDRIVGPGRQLLEPRPPCPTDQAPESTVVGRERGPRRPERAPGRAGADEQRTPSGHLGVERCGHLGALPGIDPFEDGAGAQRPDLGTDARDQVGDGQVDGGDGAVGQTERPRGAERGRHLDQCGGQVVGSDPTVGHGPPSHVDPGQRRGPEPPSSLGSGLVESDRREALHRVDGDEALDGPQRGDDAGGLGHLGAQPASLGLASRRLLPIGAVRGADGFGDGG